MGCRETVDVYPDHRRQYLKNPKRDEEVEDVTHDDEEDNYFEFEPTEKASTASFNSTNSFIIGLLMILSFINRRTT